MVNQKPQTIEEILDNFHDDGGYLHTQDGYYTDAKLEAIQSLKVLVEYVISKPEYKCPIHNTRFQKECFICVAAKSDNALIEQQRQRLAEIMGEGTKEEDAKKLSTLL